MVRQPLLLVLLLVCLLGLGACQGQGAPGAQPTGQPTWDLGPLPQSPRHAADASVFAGVFFDAVGGVTTPDMQSLIIDATAQPAPPDPGFSWARYGCNLPAGVRLNSLSLDVDLAAPNEYWVALADYGTHNRWEWHGPYTEDATPQFHLTPGSYLSPNRTFYWVVLAARGNSVRLNFSTVDFTPVMLDAAPVGESTVLTGGCLAPSLVVLPAVAPNVEAGAPVMAYIHLDSDVPKLYLAYYSAGAWQTMPLLDSHSFSLPELRWLGSEFILTAYDRTVGALLDLRLDTALNVRAQRTIFSGSGMPLANQSLDVDPGGAIGVAHAYGSLDSGRLYFSEYDDTAWQTTPALHDADTVAGVSFRYDPAGGDPWLLYTHGTVDTSSTIMIDFTLEEFRRSGGTWGSATAIPYDDSPLAVDLGFATDGTPQICCVASRVFSSEPFFSASLFYDIVTGYYSGGSWEFEPAFVSSVVPDIQFPPTVIPIDLDIGTEVRWAAPSELLYSSLVGSVDFSLESMQPTGGTLLPSSQYMIDPGTGFENSGYFTGSAGQGFDWAQGLVAAHVAAYILALPVDAVALFNGELSQASDLMYWSPPPPP